MTCPTCNIPLTPGAYCDGNGSHPLRRARRLTGEERRAADKKAAEQHEKDALRAQLLKRRTHLESAHHRRHLAGRGQLRAQLDLAISEGTITQEEADAWEAATVSALVKEREERDVHRARVEAERAARQPPAGFVAPFRFDGICIWDANNEMAADDRPEGRKGWRARGWGRIGYLPDAEAVMDAWTVWVAEAVGTDDVDGHESARRMNAKAGWVGEEPPPAQPRQEPEPRRRTSHRGALFAVALVGALMGVGGMTGEDAR